MRLTVPAAPASFMSSTKASAQKAAEVLPAQAKMKGAATTCNPYDHRCGIKLAVYILPNPL